MSVHRHERHRRRRQTTDETETQDPMATRKRPQTEPAVEQTTDHWTLNAIVNKLQQIGTRTIRIIVETEDGHQATGDGVLQLEVTALYDHWGLEEGLRRHLEAIERVEWGGDVWELEASVGRRTDPNESITVYERFR